MTITMPRPVKPSQLMSVFGKTKLPEPRLPEPVVEDLVVQHHDGSLIVQFLGNEGGSRFITWTFAMTDQATGANTIATGRIDTQPSDDRPSTKDPLEVASAFIYRTVAEIVTRSYPQLELPTIWLFARNDRLRDALNSPVHVHSRFTIVPTFDSSTLVSAARTVQTSRRMKHEAPKSFPMPVTIATDASQGKWRGVAGCAWVRQDGKFSTWPLLTANIGEAEFAAIVGAIWAHREYTEGVTIRADSKEAVQLANSALSGVIDAPTKSGRLLQRALIAVYRRSQVRVEWIKGHSGDPMNDTADRLALMQRRHAEADISSTDNLLLYERIVTDGLQDMDDLPLRIRASKSSRRFNHTNECSGELRVHWAGLRCDCGARRKCY